MGSFVRRVFTKKGFFVDLVARCYKKCDMDWILSAFLVIIIFCLLRELEKVYVTRQQLKQENARLKLELLISFSQSMKPSLQDLKKDFDQYESRKKEQQLIPGVQDTGAQKGVTKEELKQKALQREAELGQNMFHEGPPPPGYREIDHFSSEEIANAIRPQERLRKPRKFNMLKGTLTNKPK